MLEFMKIQLGESQVCLFNIKDLNLPENAASVSDLFGTLFIKVLQLQKS